MTTYTEYRVLRAFRMPADGGILKPHRFYEAGVALSADDMGAWELGDALSAETDRLITDGFIELAQPPLLMLEPPKE